MARMYYHYAPLSQTPFHSSDENIDYERLKFDGRFENKEVKNAVFINYELPKVPHFPKSWVAWKLEARTFHLECPIYETSELVSI